MSSCSSETDSHANACTGVGKRIVAIATQHCIAATAPGQGVVAGTARNAVITTRAIKSIGSTATGEGIGMETTHNRLNRNQLIAATASRALTQREVDVDTAAGRGIGSRIKTITAIKTVIRGIANKEVVC